MFKYLSVAAAALVLLTAAADAKDLWLYFSKQGDTSGVPDEWLTKTNPTVAPEQSIYVWARTEQVSAKWDIWNGLAIDVDHAVTSGISYNPFIAAIENYRWHPDSDLTWIPPDADGQYGMFAIAVTQVGLGHALDPLMVQGTGERHLLVAELAFPNLGKLYGVSMKVGAEGVALEGGGAGEVYFGFGDPDLYVLPEPGSLTLLALAALLARRR